MISRGLYTFILCFLLLGSLGGCDNRPKIVMPTTPAPPAPRPRVAGGGPAPAQPAPEAETREKLDKPKEAAPDSPPPGNKD